MSSDEAIRFVLALSLTALAAGLQIVFSRDRHRRESHVRLLQSFLTAEFDQAYEIVAGLRGGLGRREIANHLGEDIGRIYGLLSIWEEIGALVDRGELLIDHVEDIFSDCILESWRVLERFVSDERIEARDGDVWRGFENLAEQIRRRTPAAVFPATGRTA